MRKAIAVCDACHSRGIITPAKARMDLCEAEVNLVLSVKPIRKTRRIKGNEGCKVCGATHRKGSAVAKRHAADRTRR
jgi:hypothetical protein